MTGSGRKSRSSKFDRGEESDEGKNSFSESEALDNRKIQKEKRNLKRKGKTSPRKISKGKSKSPKMSAVEVFEISEVDLAEAGSSTAHQESLSEVSDHQGRKVIVRNPPREGDGRTTAVTFREENNEFVEMQVEDHVFDSADEINEQNPEEEDEAEISFNNNASLARGTVKNNVPFIPMNLPNVVETDEEREARIVDRTVAKLKEIMTTGGYLKQDVNNQRAVVPKSGKSPTTANSISKKISSQASNSESTIYKNAVEPAKHIFTTHDIQMAIDTSGQANADNVLRNSGSSDEGMMALLNVNSSDESVLANEQIDLYLSNSRNEFDNNLFPDTTQTPRRNNVRSEVHIPMATLQGEQTGQQPPQQPVAPPPPPMVRVNLEDEVSRRIRQAEASKARALELPGMDNSLNLQNPNDQSGARPFRENAYGDGNAATGNVILYNPNQFMRTAMMDEDYLIVAAHVDESLERRIRNGEFVDFARLLPRDRVQMQQDNRLELMNLNGHLTFTAASNTSGQEFSIGSFARWEQSFRVFSNIYIRQFPQRASELIQYNHVIHTASMTYSWNNVYAYDIDFRLHMARHPQRSWSVILQQAWNLRLKDRHEFGDRRHHSNGSNNQGSGKKRDICFRFNAGKCTYGARCKFDHRCGICGKHGHGAAQL